MGAFIIQQVNPTAPKQHTYEKKNAAGIYIRDDCEI